MAQHDMNIANQGFPAFRADLNSALTAIANNSSGATAPSTTFAYQWWYDTSTNALKMRNADNDAWIEIGTFNQTTDSFTPSGVTSDTISEGNSSVEVVDSGTGYVAVTVDGVERARFDNNGHFLVSQSIYNSGNVGGGILNNGFNFGTVDGGTAARFNRLTSDGDILELRKDSYKVGSMGSANATEMFIEGNNRSGLWFATNVVRPYKNGVGTDGSTDLGSSSYRFKDLYLSGGVYLGGTGSANHLDDYEEGTWTPSLWGGTTTVYGSRFGTYVKVGNVVTIAGLISITSMGDANDYIMAGIPFNPQNNYGSVGSVNWMSSAKGSYYYLVPTIGSGQIKFSSQRTLDNTWTDETNVFQDGTSIYFGLTYRVAD